MNRNHIAVPNAVLPVLAAGLCLAALAGDPAGAQPPDLPTLAAADRAAIVEDVVAALDEVYVFQEVAAEMAIHLNGRLDEGAYDEISSIEAFAERLTADLQSISHDRHLRVVVRPPRPEGGDVPDEAAREAEFREALRRDNYCFDKLEHLTGNVGYVKFDCFADARWSGPTIVAAMGFLAGSDAVIFDLRANGGGSPSAIQLILSYLFDEPRHINSFYVRRTDSERQFWTAAHVEGERLSDVPVWVLTSPFTFSAAEELTYNLQAMERATIVGETTGGGAHPVEDHQVAGYPLAVMLPFGRAVNPVTGTNWEGTGVVPDLEVPADDALRVAHALALTAIAGGETDPARRAELAFLAETLALRAKPAELAADALAAYAGTYGPRVVWVEGGRLLYRRGEGAAQELTPVGDDRFLLGDLDAFRVRFERDAAGRVVRLVGLYADGREEPHERAEP